MARRGVPVAQARRSKYRAVPTVVNGFRFASRAESARYQELLLLGRAGEIRDLELQPRFPLHVGGVQVAVYVGDFRYQERVGVVERDNGKRYEWWRDVVEDVKGAASLPLYRLKVKHLKAEYGIEVREIRHRAR